MTRRDTGETLIEVLVAVVIMAGIGVVFLAGLATAARNSSAQSERVTAHALLVSASERALTVPFVECGRPADYRPAMTANVPDGYTLRVAGVHGWNGRAYDDTIARLAADVSATARTVELDDAAGLPAHGPFRILVRDATPELMTVTERNGTTLTVTRGADAQDHQVETASSVQVCPALQRLDLVVSTPAGVTESMSVAVRDDVPATAGD